MLDIFVIILPIFLIIGLGYVAAKSGLVAAAALPALANIILYFAVPAVVVNAVGKAHFSDLFEPWFLLAYMLGSLGVLLIGLAVSRWVLRAAPGDNAIRALGMSVPNSMFIGFPLLLLLFPDDPPVTAFVMAVLVENLLVIPVALILLELSASRADALDGQRLWQVVGLRIVKNPLLLSIVLGLLLSLSGLGLPGPLDKSLTMLAQMTAALSLFFIGITLAQNRLRGVSAATGLVVVGKLALHPLLVALLVMLLPDFDPRLQVAAVVVAAAPMITIYPIIGERFGFRDFCANALFVTMLAAVFSLVVVLSWLGVDAVS